MPSFQMGECKEGRFLGLPDHLISVHYTYPWVLGADVATSERMNTGSHSYCYPR